MPDERRGLSATVGDDELGPLGRVGLGAASLGGRHQLPESL